MNFKAITLLDQIHKDFMPLSYRAILYQFLRFGNFETGRDIRPSLHTIAKRAGCTHRTVQRAKSFFKEIKLFKTQKKHCKKNKLSETLELNYEILKDIACGKVPKYQKRKSSENGCGKALYKNEIYDTVTYEIYDTESPYNNNYYHYDLNTVGIDFSVENYPPRELEVANKPPTPEVLNGVVCFLVEEIVAGRVSRESIPDRYRDAVFERIAA